MQVNTRQRILSAIFTLAILILGMLIYRNFANREPVSYANLSKKDIRQVETDHFNLTSTNVTIDIDGRLRSIDQVDLNAEVSGKLLPMKKRFKEGVYYRKGELIFNIDDTDAKYTLLALRSNLLTSITQMMPDLKFDYPEAFQRWKSYLDDYDVTNAINPLPEIHNEQVKYYVAGKSILNQYYSIKSQEDRLSDYRIYAPFSGIVTASNVSPGSLVAPGTNLGSIINTSSFELAAPVSLADLKYINIGQNVNLYSEALGKEWKGRVSRIGNLIDPTTQNIPIFITLSGKGLNQGMYLRGSILGEPIESVYKIPEELIVNQNQVYVVQDSTIQYKNVEILNRQDGAVYARGIDANDDIVISSINGLFKGQKVVVNKPKS